MHIVVLQSGGTALMEASKKGHTAVVELLLQHGADVHIQHNVRNIYVGLINKYVSYILTQCMVCISIRCILL